MSKLQKLGLVPKRSPNFGFQLITDSFEEQYIPQLASYPGDPEAKVSSKSQIRRLAARKGLRVRGYVNCDHLEVKDPPKRYEVAPDIVDREVETVVEREHGGIAPPKKKLQDIREAAAERLAGTQD